METKLTPAQSAQLLKKLAVKRHAAAKRYCSAGKFGTYEDTYREALALEAGANALADVAKRQQDDERKHEGKPYALQPGRHTIRTINTDVRMHPVYGHIRIVYFFGEVVESTCDTLIGKTVRGTASIKKEANRLNLIDDVLLEVETTKIMTKRGSFFYITCVNEKHLTME